MSLVVDPSAILSLAFEDEAADYGALVLDAVEKGGALAPSIFWYELRNVLVMNERRGRISPEKTAVFLGALRDLNIKIEPLPSDLGVLELARTFTLTVYDASYLELAARRGAAIATLDSSLIKAAKQIAVEVFPEAAS